jgi:hypothetical protein
MKHNYSILTTGALCTLGLLGFSSPPAKTTEPLKAPAPTTQPAATTVATPPVPTTPSQIVIVKNSCWKGYSVTVDYVDLRSAQHQQTVSLGPDDMEAKVNFNAEVDKPHQFSAKFSPEIWAGDSKKVFNSTQVWVVPESLPAGKERYEMRLCFPNDFQGVPAQISNVVNCVCPGDTRPD